jgi:hypothetical protein
MMAKNEKIKVPLQLVELEDENYHLLLETDMANGEKAKWIVDTGASKTVFDVNMDEYFNNCPETKTEIQSAGIGEYQIETRAGYISGMKLGSFVFDKFPVALIDLSHIKKLYIKYANEHIAGLFGSDFLVKHKAVIDFNKLILTLTM